jgi:hypothetical protein
MEGGETMVWVLMRKFEGEVEADGVFITLDAAKRAAQHAVDDFGRGMREPGGERERLEWRRDGVDVYICEAFGGECEFIINEATFEW